MRDNTYAKQKWIKYGRSLIVTQYNDKDSSSAIIKAVVGPHWPGVLITSFVIFGGSAVNLYFVFINDSLLPSTKSTFRIFIYLMCAVSHIFLCLTSFCNPGIIFSKHCLHRKKIEKLAEEESEIESWNLKQIPYCHICKILTPSEQRISHCYICGYCIERMDHHCPWMGQCIGRRNMKWFILFNISWIVFFLEYIYAAILLRK